MYSTQLSCWEQWFSVLADGDLTVYEMLSVGSRGSGWAATWRFTDALKFHFVISDEVWGIRKCEMIWKTDTNVYVLHLVQPELFLISALNRVGKTHFLLNMHTCEVCRLTEPLEESAWIPNLNNSVALLVTVLAIRRPTASCTMDALHLPLYQTWWGLMGEGPVVCHT